MTASAAVSNVFDATRTRTTTGIPGQDLDGDGDAPPKILQRGRERYEILGEHGRGGLGRVFRARDLELARDVAIKELLAPSALSEVRFLREAMITARLEHPGIVPVHEAGRWPDGTPFYAMKLVAGRPLRDLLEERNTVEQRLSLLHHVIAVADAIAYAHDNHVVHRDLKPSNIIVGDFGETIVIDWGLAKVISPNNNDSAFASDVLSTGGAAELTQEGTIIGTPAYMAPEQARGEQVDERADVYAIGAMLWELCSLQKVPPVELKARNRMLRQGGIDEDLSAIIDKCLAHDPGHRYASATELALDLKAFKAGARIAARTYSPFARIVFWIRRNRALTSSIVSGLVILMFGAAVSFLRVARERDRADLKADEAAVAAKQAELAKDDLLLQHAELLLTSDPTGSFEILASYKGNDSARAQMIRAHAKGLGVAKSKITFDDGRVSFAHGLPDGRLLVVGAKTVMKVSASGKAQIIASNVIPQESSAYNETHNWLAYPCDPGAICLIDAISGALLPISADMAKFPATALEFSPDGARLAAISGDGRIGVWRIGPGAAPVLEYQLKIDSSDQGVSFVDTETLVAIGHNRVIFLGMQNGNARLNVLRTVPTDDPIDFHVARERRAVAIATATGRVMVVSPDGAAIVSDVALCNGVVNNISFARAGRLLAYGCQDGTAGTWNPIDGTHAILGRIEGGVITVAVDPDGRMLFGGQNGNLMIYDSETLRVSLRRGQKGRIMLMFAGSSSFPYIASFDAEGELRVWDPPDSDTRVLIQERMRLFAGVPIGDYGVLALGISSVLTLARFDGAVRKLQPHNPYHWGMSLSRDRLRAGMYLDDSRIELWSFYGSPDVRVIETEHAPVSAMAYFADDSFVTAGRDGSIVHWTADAKSHSQFGQIPEAVESIVPLPQMVQLIAAGASGKLWIVNSTEARSLTPEGQSVTRARLSQDGHILAAVTAQGRLYLFDVDTWNVILQQELGSSLDDVRLNSTATQVAVTLSSSVRIVTVRSERPAQQRTNEALIRWGSVSLTAGAIGFSRDDKWFAVAGMNGVLWFYDVAADQWRCVVAGSGKFVTGYFSADGDSYFAANSDGRVWLVRLSSLKS